VSQVRPFELERVQWASDDERWNALVSRSAHADGCFLYAVTTASVFCRPSCPSRKPPRERVVFFATSEAAITAGYRPCRRCAPMERSLHQRHVIAIEQACALIEESEEPPTLDHLSEYVGLSRFYFHRIFKRYLGITPKEYATTRQLQRFKTALSKGTPILQAIYDAGFSSTSRVYERTTRELGMTPARFKAGADGICIKYAVVPAPCGELIVAATEDGVCLIEHGDTKLELVSDLISRFPDADILEEDLELAARIADILEALRDSRIDQDIPWEIQTIALQRRIWKALQLPYSKHGL
jgi:AraC family transcriptional regulator, regulatory protein of adaptative response / methylated-DNA-[protein]-cysteine methyltransferase